MQDSLQRIMIQLCMGATVMLGECHYNHTPKTVKAQSTQNHNHSTQTGCLAQSSFQIKLVIKMHNMHCQRRPVL